MAKQTSNNKSKSTTAARSHTGEAEGLRDLFEDQLKDIYWAEKALTKAIPKMIKKACADDLIEALEEHLEITEQQVTRCEEVFAAMKMKPVASKCEAMQGLIKEATEIMDSTLEGSVRDAGIIAAAQKVEHYEIATYGTLAAFAKQLGETKAASLLAKTLNEEKDADAMLTKVAESHVNEEAEIEQN
jgi:ferritin-like metal-binding protein YciE